MDYGSDNQVAEKTAILDPSPDTRLVGSPPSKARAIIACGVLGLATAGAFVAFHSTKAGPVSMATQPMTLASVHVNQAVPPPAYPTDNPVLRDGQEFIVMCGTKNLCVDDDGAVVSGDSTMRLRPCDSRSDNQVFVYDATTNAIRSSRKSNLCWNDDGSNNNGFHLKTCDATNYDTKFMYDWTTRSIRTAPKPRTIEYYDQIAGKTLERPDVGLCVDAEKYLYQQPCDPSRPSQRFEIVPKAFW